MVARWQLPVFCPHVTMSKGQRRKKRSLVFMSLFSREENIPKLAGISSYGSELQLMAFFGSLNVHLP
jgi:hypothetical protein